MYKEKREKMTHIFKKHHEVLHFLHALELKFHEIEHIKLDGIPLIKLSTVLSTNFPYSLTRHLLVVEDGTLKVHLSVKLGMVSTLGINPGYTIKETCHMTDLGQKVSVEFRNAHYGYDRKLQDCFVDFQKETEKAVKPSFFDVTKESPIEHYMVMVWTSGPQFSGVTGAWRPARFDRDKDEWVLYGLDKLMNETQSRLPRYTYRHWKYPDLGPRDI